MNKMVKVKARREMRENDTSDREPTTSLLDDVVRRIVDAVQPLKIILFGSAARGDMGPDSDLDLLIVIPEGSHRRQTALAAYRALRGLGRPKDVIAVTESDIIEHRENPSLIIKPALDEGRAIYG
jgi:predicted nucleotidyltransferase